MATNEYPLGNVVRLTAAVKVAGTLQNTTMAFLVLPPTGAAVTVTPVVNDSTGNYHADYTPALHGTYYYRAAGTGAVVAAAEGAFVVNHSRFA